MATAGFGQFRTQLGGETNTTNPHAAAELEFDSTCNLQQRILQRFHAKLYGGLCCVIVCLFLWCADQAYISKGLILFTAAFSIAAQASRKVGLFNIDLGKIASGEVWRLITHPFVFG